jgi:hypothetical protein
MNSTYSTTDIYFASFLIATGQFSLTDIQGHSSSKKTFVFNKEPAQGVVLGFYSGTAKVSAIRLLEALQTLKSATYMVGHDNSRKGESI